MRKLSVFNHTSLDGFFTDPKGDMSWAHARDAEWHDFAEANAGSGGEMLFGRVTYDLMASYWPTSNAQQNDPIIAERMNNAPKVVFSRTMDKPAWSNTRLVKGDIASAVRTMKQQPGPDLVIMGSGSIVSQLAEEGLIDLYQIAVGPIILGKGRTLFEGLSKKQSLKLTQSRTFQNGNVFLCYEPAS